MLQALSYVCPHGSIIQVQKQNYKFDGETVNRYQDNLRKDPNSLVFAALAEAYWERGLEKEAELLI